MAFSKAKDFPPVLYEQSIWAKAQSHPARIVILLYLLEHGSTSFTILKSLLPLASTTVSRHLHFLHRYGFIIGRNAYPTTIYKLDANCCKRYARKLLLLQKEFTAPVTAGKA